MRNPKAGPAAYFLLRGEGNSEDATSPARSASFLVASILHFGGSSVRRSVAIDDEVFQTLLEQVRELHRRTDEITSSKTRMHDHIRARLSWNDPPSLPSAQRDLADEVVEALGNARPSTSQSRQLWRAYFGK
jgi:hypothetical protein